MSFVYLEITRGMEIGKKFILQDGAISIGRNESNNITFPVTEKSVSGHHAIIYKNPERILLQDMQSTNGTFVNEEKVMEREISIGDIIGFGKNGPRLRLAQSETQPTSNEPKKQFSMLESTEIRDKPGKIPKADDRTSEEDQNTIFRLKKQSEDNQNSFNPSVTLEYEQKLVNNKLSSDEMNKLMKNGQRLEKIIERGKIGNDQSSILKTMYHMNKNLRRTWSYIIAAVLLVSLSVSSYFAIRTYQYKQLLSKAQLLQKAMDENDKKIASVNQDPDQNKEELKKLISEQEQTLNDFSSLTEKLNQNDVGKIYSDPVEKRIADILERYGETNYHIPKEMTAQVKYHIGIYSGNLHSTIARYLQRKETYFPMIYRVFREKNIPIELAYVSMLESGFNPLALSHCGARGLWQFMPETGRRYNLQVNDAVDERTDPEKASYAAAQYFKELIGMFGGKSSVMLCMAAYNAGEGSILKALRKIDDPMRNRDFWYIYRMGYLAEETNEYIPRVIALMIISEHPQEYGFNGTGAAPTEPVAAAEKDFIEIDYRVQ